MTWNYRVCRQTYKNDIGYDELFYEIREAYYNNDGEIWAVTEKAQSVYGETIDGVKQCLAWMQQALQKDVIDLDTFVFAKQDPSN